MSAMHNEAGLEIDEDIQQQCKVWRIERICWCVMALLILAALTGLLGHGPLSSTTFDDPASGLLVQYERFERANAPTSFRIQVKSQEGESMDTRISLGSEFFSKVEVSRIEPEPAGVEVWPDHLTYEFSRPDTANPATIRVHYKPLDFGRIEIEMGLEGFPTRTFSQFIYP
jgi:hypothetical protein